MEMVWCVVMEREREGRGARGEGGGRERVGKGGIAALARGGAGRFGRAGVTTETRAHPISSRG